MTPTEQYRPQTPVERELLAECVQVSEMHGAPLSDVLADAVRWWGRAGRSIRPRQWRSRVAAAERLIARGHAIAEFAAAGLDPFVEVAGFARMDADQLRDEVVYLADHQG